MVFESSLVVCFLKLARLQWMLAAPRVARLTPGSRRHVVTLCRRVQVMVSIPLTFRAATKFQPFGDIKEALA